MSINSQPAVNGAKSDHPLFGWGGMGGRVYQKAYLEFFTSPENLKKIVRLIENKPNLVYYAVDCNGVVCSSQNSSISNNGGNSNNNGNNNSINSNNNNSNNSKNVTALTWGVFPNKEILQPTIFDPNTFLVWSQEAFELWTNAWAALYDDETDSCGLIYDVSIRMIKSYLILIYSI